MLTKSFERDLLSYLSPDAYWAASVKLQVRKQTPEEPLSEEDEKHAVSDSQMPTFDSTCPAPQCHANLTDHLMRKISEAATHVPPLPAFRAELEKEEESLRPPPAFKRLLLHQRRSGPSNH